MTYKNILNRSTILAAQLQTDVKDMDENRKAGLYNGIYGIVEMNKDIIRWAKKASELCESILFEQEQAGIIAGDLTR
jgi:hypothetical protein